MGVTRGTQRDESPILRGCHVLEKDKAAQRILASVTQLLGAETLKRGDAETLAIQ